MSAGPRPVGDVVNSGPTASASRRAVPKQWTWWARDAVAQPKATFAVARDLADAGDVAGDVEPVAASGDAPTNNAATSDTTATTTRRMGINESPRILDEVGGGYPAPSTQEPQLRSAFVADAGLVARSFDRSGPGIEATMSRFRRVVGC